jgi:PLD-like domain
MGEHRNASGVADKRYADQVLRRFVLPAVVALGLLGLSAEGAEAAYSPHPGAIFNRPVGTTAQKYVFVHHLNKTIDSTRAGQTIRVATYSMDKDVPIGSHELTTARHLVRAHRRGVIVKVLIDDHQHNAQNRILRRQLGSNRNKPSYIHVCLHGCRTGRFGNLHEKLYMFSRAGRSNRVVMISSANPTNGQAVGGWNNTYTIVNKPRIYDFFKGIFDNGMRRDKLVRHPYRQLTAGNISVAVFPRHGPTTATDNVLRALAKVRCTGATGSSGFHGRTVVKVSVFSWSDARGEAIARKLWRLESSGCYVGVIMANSSPTFRHILLRPTAGGRVIKVYDSLIDTTGNGIPDKYAHNKYLLISGHFGGSTHDHYVLTGSQNYTRSSLRNGDEILVGIHSGPNYVRYNRNYKDVVAHGSRRLTLAKSKLLDELSLPVNSDGEVD